MSKSNLVVLFRDYQLELLDSLIDVDSTLTTPNLILQGYSGTGKTLTLRKVFELKPDIINVWLDPIEVVSWKPLFQAIARSTQQRLMQKYPGLQDKEYDPMAVEEPSFLVKYLIKLFSHYKELPEKIPLYIVYDGFDSLQDLDSQILYKLLKLHELLPNDNAIVMKSIYTVRDLNFVNRYSSNAIPMVVFPRYNLDEIIKILILTRAQELVGSSFLVMQLELLDECEYTDESLEKVAVNFIQLIVQAFHSYTGNDIYALNDLIDFKWPLYLKNLDKNNILDPLALYRANVRLFITTDDSLKNDFNDTYEDYSDTAMTQTYELSNISKYLLIAAYFCSYIETKFDIGIFSKRGSKAANSKRKKKEQNPRYLQPSFFYIERLLAIFQSIYPLEIEVPKGSLAALKVDDLMKSNVEVFQNLAELFSLKLITCSSSKNLDVLGNKIKWRVNIPWEIISEIASSVSFDISEYFSGVHD
ncbi:AAA ATPase domain [Nakaseomyces glabratus]|nr:hypothetical protein LTX96_0001506 [Nakaseomyces glabratus]